MNAAWRRTADSQTHWSHRTFSTVDEVITHYGTNWNRILYSDASAQQGLPLHIAETVSNHATKLFRHPICRFYGDSPLIPAEWTAVDEDPHSYYNLQINTTTLSEIRWRCLPIVDMGCAVESPSAINRFRIVSVEWK
jgi:hypothetical protein